MKLLKIADVRDVLDQYDKEEISFSKMVDILNETALKNLELQKSKPCSCSFEIVKNDKTQSGYEAVNFKKISEKEIEQAHKIMKDKIKREEKFTNNVLGLMGWDNIDLNKNRFQ